MIELHWTEVDHVPAVWADAGPPLRAGLLFRAGHADETLATLGRTHLIEHLAFSAMNDELHRHNGIVDATITGFFTVGHPGDVSAFLAKVCDALSSLPAGRLEDEKRVLAAESAARSRDVCSQLLMWRYGAAGHGLAAMPEFGLRMATLEPLQEYAARRFTRGNAVLWLTGPPPDDLRLRLPQGPKRPLPALAPIQDALPGWFVDRESGGMAAGATVPRACASTIFAECALARLRKRLRVERAVSYAPAVFYVPLDADTAHLVLCADSSQDRRAELSDAFGEVFTALREIDAAEVDAARARIDEQRTGALAPPRAERAASEAYRAALDWIFDKPFEPGESLDAQFSAATAEDVSAIARRMQETTIFALPAEARLRPWCGERIPGSTAPVVSGRELPHLEAPTERARLVYGPDGVSVVFADGSHCTVRYSHLAAALKYADGGVRLIGSDAATVMVEPTLWQDGRDACYRIMQRVPADLLIAYPARPAQAIPVAEKKRGRMGNAMIFAIVYVAALIVLRILFGL